MSSFFPTLPLPIKFCNQNDFSVFFYLRSFVTFLANFSRTLQLTNCSTEISPCKSDPKIKPLLSPLFSRDQNHTAIETLGNVEIGLLKANFRNTAKMSDMDYDSDEYDIEYSDPSDSEPDVNLENQYYNAKSLKGDNYDGALQGFAHVLEIEGDEKGVWGFKVNLLLLSNIFQVSSGSKTTDKNKLLLGKI